MDLNKALEELLASCTEETRAQIKLAMNISEETKARRLEAQAERNLKISMLEKMDNAAVGAAFIQYANSLKYGEEAEGLQDEAADAYSLIRDILHLEMWEC